MYSIRNLLLIAALLCFEQYSVATDKMVYPKVTALDKSSVVLINDKVDVRKQWSDAVSVVECKDMGSLLDRFQGLCRTVQAFVVAQANEGLALIDSVPYGRYIAGTVALVTGAALVYACCAKKDKEAKQAKAK